MDNKIIRVAITHGDTNGVGYELIFRTFEAQEMLELCTPVIYGSPKASAFHRNALQMQVSYTNIGNVTEAKDGRLNMLGCLPRGSESGTRNAYGAIRRRSPEGPRQSP